MKRASAPEGFERNRILPRPASARADDAGSAQRRRDAAEGRAPQRTGRAAPGKAPMLESARSRMLGRALCDACRGGRFAGDAPPPGVLAGGHRRDGRLAGIPPPATGPLHHHQGPAASTARSARWQRRAVVFELAVWLGGAEVASNPAPATLSTPGRAGSDRRGRTRWACRTRTAGN